MNNPVNNPAGNAVPFYVPAPFLLSATSALAAVFITLALKPHLLLGAYAGSYAVPPLLALVHTLTLGFATMTFVGAMHQLMPVLLVTRLYSVRLGTVTYLLLVTGTVGVVMGFAADFQVTWLAFGGGLELLGLLIFNYNLWRTNRSVAKRDAVSHAVLAAAFYLAVAVTLGLLIASSRTVPALAGMFGDAVPLHLGIGLFGAFFLAIVGAGHKLLAMFVLAHGVSQQRLQAIVWLVHGAMLTLALHMLTRLTLLPLVAGLLLVAAILFGLDMYTILAKRMRKHLDLSLRHFLLAGGFLVLATLLLVQERYPAAVFSLLGGFITLAIAGMLIKITSFLTWQHRYAARIGKERVPMLHDMNQDVLSWISLSGLGLGALGITLTLVQPFLWLAILSSSLAALGAVSLLIHVLWIMFGWHQPATDKRVAASQVRGV